jgi:hypothetical protein
MARNLVVVASHSMAPFHFPRRSHESPQFAASWQEIQKNLPEKQVCKG